MYNRLVFYFDIYVFLKICKCFNNSSDSLHFAEVVDNAKCILVTRVCVSLSVCVSVCLWLAAFPHYCMDLDVTLGEW